MGTEAWKKSKLWKTIRASQPDVLGVLEVGSDGLWKISEKQGQVRSSKVN